MVLHCCYPLGAPATGTDEGDAPAGAPIGFGTLTVSELLVRPESFVRLTVTSTLVSAPNTVHVPQSTVPDEDVPVKVVLGTRAPAPPDDTPGIASSRYGTGYSLLAV